MKDTEVLADVLDSFVAINETLILVTLKLVSIFFAHGPGFIHAGDEATGNCIIRPARTTDAQVLRDLFVAGRRRRT